jgi:histidyl-tRNA synthetase
MFRHERPQKGRYREFQQIGVEALGFSEPCVDAELIAMLQDLWGRLGIENTITLEINCIGSSKERLSYKKALVAYLEDHQEALDEKGQKRLRANPLRLLDSKDSTIQKIVVQAPQLLDYLGEASKSHYEEWKALLRGLQIDYVENPYLVRGLDYYNLSVFEWVSSSLGAQGTVCAGGRYDGLMEQLGGKATPAVGFAMGIERLMLLLNPKATPIVSPDIYLIHQGEGTASLGLQISQNLRRAGYKVIQHGSNEKFTHQFKRANTSRAEFAVVIGEKEIASNSVTIKPLFASKGQQTVKQVDMIKTLALLRQ